jgi:hypothetical protein
MAREVCKQWTQSLVTVKLFAHFFYEIRRSLNYTITSWITAFLNTQLCFKRGSCISFCNLNGLLLQHDLYLPTVVYTQYLAVQCNFVFQIETEAWRSLAISETPLKMHPTVCVCVCVWYTLSPAPLNGKTVTCFRALFLELGCKTHTVVPTLHNLLLCRQCLATTFGARLFPLQIFAYNLIPLVSWKMSMPKN